MDKWTDRQTKRNSLQNVQKWCKQKKKNRKKREQHGKLNGNEWDMKVEREKGGMGMS